MGIAANDDGCGEERRRKSGQLRRDRRDDVLDRNRRRGRRERRRGRDFYLRTPNDDFAAARAPRGRRRQRRRVDVLDDERNGRPEHAGVPSGRVRLVSLDGATLGIATFDTCAAGPGSTPCSRHTRGRVSMPSLHRSRPTTTTGGSLEPDQPLVALGNVYSIAVAGRDVVIDADVEPSTGSRR